ncbi:MAG: hypothetical protein HYX68_23605 [Planctomycetes bacterium]|jgi:hypothetical protein|nr:hypothetical protein [Planctomycetota bacterium]
MVVTFKDPKDKVVGTAITKIDPNPPKSGGPSSLYLSASEDITPQTPPLTYKIEVLLTYSQGMTPKEQKVTGSITVTSVP